MSWTERTMRLHADFMEGMTDAERVAYLQDMLAGEITNRGLRIARCIDAVPGGLGRRPAALLVILSDAPGRTLTYDHIAARMEEQVGSYTTLSSIQTAVKHARAALRQTDWPVTITTETGVGLRMTMRDGWQPPWTLPPPSALDRGAWVRGPFPKPRG
ncbi:MAG: helix-turn-helix domain-containing protein [Pigmentiphaga sp.]|nr:helix-turn-helix domain-containing protein [Pigmentiphaga sp.]